MRREVWLFSYENCNKKIDLHDIIMSFCNWSQTGHKMLAYSLENACWFNRKCSVFN